MSSTVPRQLIEVEYAAAAQAYLRSLPPEHFMEARPQATQREITVESFALLKVHRPDVHTFNEMLVQYQLRRSKEIRQVVPDNMLVVSNEPIEAEGSYDVPLQPVGPYLVLEYVSKSSKRKDYQINHRIYETELKVPYYLLFYPETQDMTLFRRGSKRYVSVKPNEAGRVAIPDLDLEAALLDGWVRFWYRGELLPLPAELQSNLDALEEQLRQAQEQTKEAQEQKEQERTEKERLLTLLREHGIDPGL
jgi:Uma2 family endonuclease